MAIPCFYSKGAWEGIRSEVQSLLCFGLKSAIVGPVLWRVASRYPDNPDNSEFTEIWPCNICICLYIDRKLFWKWTCWGWNHFKCYLVWTVFLTNQYFMYLSYHMTGWYYMCYGILTCRNIYTCWNKFYLFLGIVHVWKFTRCISDFL